MDNSLIPLRSGIAVALFLAAIWGIAAALNPMATYHLAPLLIVGAVPFAARDLEGKTMPILIGLAIALGTTLIIAAFGLLRGPSLLPTGGALLEAIALTTGAVVVGLMVVRLVPRR